MKQKCPICEGRGIVAGGFYITVVGEIMKKKCRLCNGTGFIYTVNHLNEGEIKCLKRLLV